MGIFYSGRLLRRTAFAATAFTAVLSVGLAQAQTGQSSTPGNTPPAGSSSSMGLSEAPASATGTVTAVNTSQRKVTLDHGPISAINWPAMKMEFPAARSVDLTKIKPGTKVQFTLSGTNGSYTVQSLSPVP